MGVAKVNALSVTPPKVQNDKIQQVQPQFQKFVYCVKYGKNKQKKPNLECNDLQISQNHILFSTEHRKYKTRICIVLFLRNI